MGQALIIIRCSSIATLACGVSAKQKDKCERAEDATRNIALCEWSSALLHPDVSVASKLNAHNVKSL